MIVIFRNCICIYFCQNSIYVYFSWNSTTRYTISDIPQHRSDHDIDMNLFSWQKPQAKQIMKRLLYTIFSNFLQLIFSIFVPGMKYDFWKFCSQTSKQTKIKCKHLQFKCQFQLNDAWKVIIDTEKSWVNSLFGRLINKDRKRFFFFFNWYFDFYCPIFSTIYL